MKFDIPTEVKRQIRDHALSNSDIETCGYWLPSSDSLLVCENVANNPKTSFTIDPDYHISVVKRFPNAVIFHSHLGDDTPAILSQRDIIASKSLKMPYLVHHVDFNEWDYFDPANLNPYPLKNNPYSPDMIEFYLGIPWQWERFDCYSLWRNIYKGILGIDLRDFSRGGNEGVVTSPNWNQYLENYESQGFTAISKDEPLQNWDVLLMCLLGTQIHHALIVVDAANNIGVEIVGEGRVSERVKITKSHINRAKPIVRHKNFIKD